MNGMTSMPKAWSTIKMDLALDQILGVSPGETSSMPHSPPGTEQDTLSNWPGKVFANRIPDRLYLWSSEHTVLLWQPPAWPSLFLPFSPNVWPRSKLSWREEKPSQEPPQSPLWSLRLCPQQDLCTSRFWGALGWGFIPTTLRPKFLTGKPTESQSMPWLHWLKEVLTGQSCDSTAGLVRMPAPVHLCFPSLSDLAGPPSLK